MIVSNMHSFFYKNRSGPVGPNVAAIDVNLDLSDMILRSAVSVVERVQDPSPCLVQALDGSCHSRSSHIASGGSVRFTSFLYDGHPADLMKLVSGIETPTRQPAFSHNIVSTDYAIEAVEDGIRSAAHTLMTMRALRPSRPDPYQRPPELDRTSYWVGMALRMGDRRGFLVQASITDLVTSVEGVDEAITHLVLNPRLKTTWSPW
jgi:hypothetical protein